MFCSSRRIAILTHVAVLCCFVQFPIAAHGVVANFNWHPNQESNLAGYKINYATVSGVYGSVIDVGNPPVQADGNVHGQVEYLVEGTTYYFAVTAYDTNGNESDPSAEVAWTAVSETISDPPVALDSFISGNEDTQISGTLAVDNTDEPSLQYSITSNPVSGALTVDDVTGKFAYRPASDFSGQDMFSFTASNSYGVSNIATVTVDVLPVNDAPVAQTASITTSEDTAVSGRLTAYDEDGNALTYSLTGQAGNGNVIVYSNGTFTYYISNQNWYGTDAFTFSVYDGTANSNTATVTINVTSVNDVPIANNQSMFVGAGTTTSGSLTAVDVEGDSLTFAMASAPSQGTVFINSDGSFSYTAEQGASGSDFFSFTVNDGSGSSLPATVSIAITAQNPPISFELIEIHADSNWQYVSFADSFTNPVVITKATSFNDHETGVVRVRNITDSGLELRYQEWDYLDGVHLEEMITLMVVEAGSFTLDNGAMVEAGCFQASGTGTFTPVSLQQSMNTSPVVLAAVNSVNETEVVTIRVRNISTSRFEFMLQEQEANAASHVEETVCYLAWEPSMGLMGTMRFEVAATGDLITSSDLSINYSSRFVETPFVLAGQQTTNGIDTAVLSVISNTMDTLTVSVSEEQSGDLETDHAGEIGGYIAIASNVPNGDPDMDGLTTEAEDSVYNSHPGIADTDQDGIDDGVEIDLWLSLGSSWDIDIDQDGLVNLLDTDADGDGMTDGEEIAAGYDPSDSTDQTSPSTEPILSVKAYKEQGKKYAELTWFDASSTNVDIYRDGRLITFTTNDGLYTHGPFSSGKPATYLVCEATAPICSNEVTVSW